MVWWTRYKTKKHVFGVKMNFIKFALKNGADDVIIQKTIDETKHVRFANNNIKI